MATANFSINNTKNYYVILDTEKYEDEDGNEKEMERDYYDFQSIMDNIRYSCEKDGYSETDERLDDAQGICSKREFTQFNDKSWFTEMCLESTIAMRSGYYQHAVLDYELKVSLSYGNIELYLSDYDNADDMTDDIMDELESIVEWRGMAENWNKGTFKIQRKNIRKWVLNAIEKEMELADRICKDNSEVELAVSARFSNGETWYEKVG